MKKQCIINENFEYELLNENQQDVGLREKLASLYASPYSDILWYNLLDPSENDGYFKLFYYEQNELLHIILFKYSAKQPKKIFVQNQQFKITTKDVKNICHILFNEFDKVQQIIFENILEHNHQQLSKMAIEITWLNDIVISDIPNSMDAYMKSLGASTRKHIKLMKNHIDKDFPDFTVHFFEKTEITFKQIENIMNLYKNRLKNKNRTPLYLHDTDTKIMHQYVSTSGFGLLCVCEIDKKIVAGTINSVIGEHAYMHVIAHDEAYNKYSIGKIALIHATQFLIEQKNIKYYHLGTGKMDYKFRHGGVSHNLFNILVFRNYNIYNFFGKNKSTLKDFHRKLEMKYKIEYKIQSVIKKVKKKIQN